MKSIYQIMSPDGCGVEVENFGLKEGPGLENWATHS